MCMRPRSLENCPTIPRCSACPSTEPRGFLLPVRFSQEARSRRASIRCLSTARSGSSRRCGKPMPIVAAITSPGQDDVIEKILDPPVDDELYFVDPPAGDDWLADRWRSFARLRWRTGYLAARVHSVPLEISIPQRFPEPGLSMPLDHPLTRLRVVDPNLGTSENCVEGSYLQASVKSGIRENSSNIEMRKDDLHAPDSTCFLCLAPCNVAALRDGSCREI